MIAPRLSLDGPWEFLYTSEDGPASGPLQVRSIEVPGPWQAQFPDLRMSAGIGIYRRHVELPREWQRQSKRVYLRFGAVFHNSSVWVNGKLVGTNEGGFLPFSFDVTGVVVEGPNEIKVRAESPTDDPTIYSEAPFAEIPFGKQSWYGPLSGIWQSVYLELLDHDHVARLDVSPDLASGRLSTTVLFARDLSRPLEVQLSVFDPSGALVARTTKIISKGAAQAAVDLEVPDVQAWSPDHPNLYLVAASLTREGMVIDRAEDEFGFRSIETRDGRLYLNGAPLYLRAALDQDYYPDTICTVPSVEFLEDQFRKAKALGLNCVRCHIKAADPRYYEAADRVGILVWTELPNGGLSTVRSRARKEALLKGIIDRDRNHPSIIIWTIINENWGVDLVHDADHRTWLKRTYAWLKAYDPARLVVDNSPLAPSFHVQSDLADYHFYAAYPDDRDAWDRFVEKLATRTAWQFSPEGDAVVTGDEPRLCSEFGNWGLPNPADLRAADGGEPWWFETGHDWGEGVMYAHGIENRFKDWSLDRVFGRLKGFVDAAQWQQFRALKYQIEAMRRQPRLAGYVITELTDCHWESNGLLDMRRNPRVFHDAFHTINADTVIVPRWKRLSYWAGETAEIELAVAHGAGAPLEGAVLEATLGADGRTFALPQLEAGAVAPLGTAGLRMPDEDKPRVHRLDMKLRGPDGTLLATNHLDLAVHPTRTAPAPHDLVWSPDPDIRAHLRSLGYPVAVNLEAAALVVASKHNEEIAAYVRDGGKLLLLPQVEGSLYPFFPHWQKVTVKEREGTVWAGDWASSFAWLRRGSAFESFPGGPLLDEAFDRVIPTTVIAGCNLLDFHSRVHAGLVVGWIHKPVALAVERAYGRGRFVASTFRLFRDAPGADPTATLLLDRLLALALGSAQAEHEGVRAADAA